MGAYKSGTSSAHQLMHLDSTPSLMPQVKTPDYGHLSRGQFESQKLGSQRESAQPTAIMSIEEHLTFQDKIKGDECYLRQESG